MPVTDDIISKTGLSDPFAKRMGRLEGMEDKALNSMSDLAGKQADVARESEDIAKRKAEAQRPAREEIKSKVKEAPDTKVDYEEAPKYQRPTMEPDQLKETFGALMAASMIVGVASRGPFNNVMNAMTGSMNGFMQQNEQLVKDSLADFDRNLSAIKERNGVKRQKVEDAWKKHQNDLLGLKTELEIIGAEFDDLQMIQAARSKSLSEMMKLTESNLKTTETAISRMVQAQQQAQTQQARLEEAKARREEANERWGENMRFRRDQAKEKAGAKSKQAEDKVSGMTSLIDQAVNMIEADPTVVGGIGKISRGVEWAANATGISDETPGSDFLAVMTQLKNEYKKSPYGGAATKFKADAATVDSVVQGLGSFTSPQAAKNSLLGLKNHLQGLAYKDVGEEAPAAAPGGAVLTATNPKNGEKVQSTDGGVTWQPVK